MQLVPDPRFAGPFRPEGPNPPSTHLPPDLDRYLGSLAIRWARATPMHEPRAVLDAGTMPPVLAPARDRRLLLLEASFTLGHPENPYAAGGFELAVVSAAPAAAALWLEEYMTPPWTSSAPGSSYRVSAASPERVAAHVVLAPLAAAVFDALLPALAAEITVDHGAHMPVCPRCMARPDQFPVFTDHEQIHHPILDTCVDAGVHGVLDALCAHGVVPLSSCERSGDGLAYVSFLAPRGTRITRPPSASAWEIDEDGCAMVRWPPARMTELAAELAPSRTTEP